MEVVVFGIYLLFCLALPMGVAFAVGLFVGRRGKKAAPPAPVIPPGLVVGQHIEFWLREGALSAEEAAPILRLLAPAEQPAVIATPVAPAEAVVQPAVTAAPVVPAPVVPPAASAPVAQPAPTPRPSNAERMWAGVMALRTRQLVLFLGTFLLLVSALVLAVFNWTNFPPLLQCMLLAAVCGSLWGAGEFLERRWKLPQAGAGLRAVGGVLAPIVLFAIGRLLAMDMHATWLLASVASTVLYAFEARRTRQMLFSIAGSLAGASTVAAVFGYLSWDVVPVALLLVCAAYLPLTVWLVFRLPEIAAGPRIIAHIVAAMTLLVTGALSFSSGLPTLAFGSALIAAMAVYGTAAWLDRWPVWAWLAGALGPIALIVLCSVGQMVQLERWLLPMFGLLALYLAGAYLLRRRRQAAFALPFFVIAHAMAILTLLAGHVLWGETLLAWALWLGFAFYGLAFVLDRQRLWLWPFVALFFYAATYSGHFVLQLPLGYQTVVLEALALAVVVAAWFREPHGRLFPLPAWTFALLWALGAAAFALPDVRGTQLTLPFLLVILVLLVASGHHNRLQMLPQRSALAAGALVGFALLLPAWLWYLLDLASLAPHWRAVLLLPTAALAFAAARFWPGRLRPTYAFGLRGAATVVALTLALLTNGQSGALLAGMAVLTLVWAFQTVLQRHQLWATLTLASALLAIATALSYYGVPFIWQLATGLLATTLYTVGASAVRNTNWRCFFIPGLGLGSLAAEVTLIAVLWFFKPYVANLQSGAIVLGFAALLVGHTWFWKRPVLGYGAAPLFAFAAVLAAPAVQMLGLEFAVPGHYALLLGGITLVFLAAGELLRRANRAYALPYEQASAVLLVGGLFLAMGEASFATLLWLEATLCCLYATFRRRIDWMLLPAFLAADVTLLFGATWWQPNSPMDGLFPLLMAATWVQALIGLGMRFWRKTLQPPAYVAALLTGSATLVVAFGVSIIQGLSGDTPGISPLLYAGFSFALLLGLLASAERREMLAWPALAFLALGLGLLHEHVGAALGWNLGLGVAEALVLACLGWALDVLAQKRWRTVLSVWRRPLLHGMLAAGTLLTLLSLLEGFSHPSLAMVFALVMLALLIATIAVREGSILLGYTAGGVLVGALLAQFFVWELSLPEWYTLPAGIYLLVVADGLRRFRGRRQVARMLETGALVLMLGVATTRTIQAEGIDGLLLTLSLCVQSALVLGYGVLRKLQVPFFGGTAGVVFGVLWLGIDPLRATNTWAIIGVVGLLLVALYVLLERHQEQLVRAGRQWIERVAAWG